MCFAGGRSASTSEELAGKRTLHVEGPQRCGCGCVSKYVVRAPVAGLAQHAACLCRHAHRVWLHSRKVYLLSNKIGGRLEDKNVSLVTSEESSSRNQIGGELLLPRF